MRFEWFVAQRYLRSPYRPAVLRLVTLFSMIGVAAGVATLVIALSMNTGFRETLLSYYDACAGLGARLHRAFASDLGLSRDFFGDKFDRPMATLRLLHYPAPSRGSDPQTGAGAKVR